MMEGVCGLTRESSETIGFVLTSVMCSAIDLEELGDWCYQVIGQLEVEQVPGYVFDLMEYKGTLAGLYKVVGFVPSWTHSDEEVDALYGVAVKRGRDTDDWPITSEAALSALAKCPGIEERFRKTFPFISF